MAQMYSLAQLRRRGLLYSFVIAAAAVAVVAVAVKMCCMSFYPWMGYKNKDLIHATIDHLHSCHAA
jgi:hypothetical protein